jgi:hypothetical protein
MVSDGIVLRVYLKLGEKTMAKMIYYNEEEMKDLVNNPPHYNKGDIECIDAIEAMLTHEEFVGYLRGNSLKYRWRFRYKNGIQDLEKAEWYENKLIEILKDEERD